MSSQEEHVLDTTKSYFNIQSKQSNLYLDVMGSGYNNGATICQYTKGDYDKQKFLLVAVPEESNTYHIIAKSSGLFFDVIGSGDDNGAKICQYTKGDHDKQKFILERVGADFYKIKVKHSGLYLDVIGSGDDNGAEICQYTGGDYDKQEWKLNPAEPLTSLVTTKVEPFSAPRPRLLGPVKPKDSQKWYVVHRDVIPFFKVKDGSLTDSEKVQRSPVYFLEARQRYITNKDWFQDNQTSETVELEFENTSGWSENQSREFSSTTGITVSAGVSWGPLETSVEISHEVTNSRGSESGKTGEKSNKITIPVGANKTVAAWAIETKFVMSRMDGSTVKEWDVHGGYLIDEYPDEKTAGIPQSLVPFLVRIEEALEQISTKELKPAQGVAIAELARAAVAIVTAREPD